MDEYTGITRIRPIAGRIARPEASDPVTPHASVEHADDARLGSATTALGSLMAGLVVRHAANTRGI
jgi:hypothetical protein